MNRLTIVTALALSLFQAACSAEPANIAEHSGKVVRVVDGDSLYLSGLDMQIRLFEVDAPETNESGYTESKAHLRTLALDKNVSCREVERDRYARIVARCFLADGREINRLMLDEPNTQEYCRYSNGYYGGC